MNKKINHLERTLKALASRRRLAIIRCIREEGQASVSDIASTIRLSFKATSKHLGILASADIIDREQKGLHVWYHLSPEMGTVAKYISNSLE